MSPSLTTKTYKFQPALQKSRNFGWASGQNSILSEFGTFQLEFVYLSDVTGNPVYRDRVMRIRQVLKDLKKPNGLYPSYVDPTTGKFGEGMYSRANR